MNVLLLDAARVAFDYVGEVCRLLREETDLPIYPRDVVTWEPDIALLLKGHHAPQRVESVLHRRMTEKGFCAGIPVMPGACEAVQELEKEGTHVVFLTTPYAYNPFWLDESSCSVRKHFGQHEVISVFQKKLISGDLFLDAKPENVAAWGERWYSGATSMSSALLWDTPQNQQAAGLRRIHAWSEVIELVEQMPHKSR